MAVDYDERVICQFADRLYRRAASTIGVYTFLGGLIGVLVVVLGGASYAARSGHWPGLEGPGIFVGGIAAMIGFFVGRERAFTLRLTAQTALCQAQIERNTRMVAVTAAQQVMGATHQVTGPAQPPPVPRGA
jgi:hypothetical protein